MAENDKELEAMSTTVKALADLSDEERGRVLEYISKRFGGLSLSGKSFEVGSRDPQSSPVFLSSEERVGPSQYPLTDIKTLRTQKKPSSDLQMAVLVAYYLKEHAPSEQRKDSIDTSDVSKYFTQAGYPLPTGKNGAADTLNNARKGGYLDPLGNGSYKLNPVGFNLAAYSLPKDSGSTGSRIKKKPSKKLGKKQTKK